MRHATTSPSSRKRVSPFGCRDHRSAAATPLRIDGGAPHENSLSFFSPRGKDSLKTPAADNHHTGDNAGAKPRRDDRQHGRAAPHGGGNRGGDRCGQSPADEDVRRRADAERDGHQAGDRENRVGQLRGDRESLPVRSGVPRGIEAIRDSGVRADDQDEDGQDC